jgi:hypothetical protein
MFGMDRAFVVSYSGYADRLGPMKRELSRVGIDGDTEIVYTFDNPFDAVALRSIRHNDKIERNHSFYNLTMGHYSVLKTSIARGIGRIMVMEDDCRFLNDTGSIRSAMSAAPKDWEVLVLDSFKPPEGKAGATGWLPCTFSRSSACYCLNGSGAAKLVSLIEACTRDPDSRLQNIDGYFDPHSLFKIAKAYRAYPNLAIQADTAKSVSGINGRLYRSIGIDCGNYAGF